MARGKINIKKMHEKHEEVGSRGGDIWNPELGETLVYIHPPCRSDDEHEPTEGLPYVPIEVHYNVGGSDGPMMPSLDADANPILEHPFVKEVLKKRKVKITSDECPIAEWVADEADDNEADRARRQSKWIWGITPLAYKAPKAKGFTDLEPKPSLMIAGFQIHDGIMDAFDELEDITDYDGAIFLKIKKKGKKLNTKYTVDPDTKSLRKPVELDEALVKKLDEAMKDGGDCDLFRFAANLFKGTAEADAACKGIELDEDDDEDDDDEPTSRKSKSKKGKPKSKKRHKEPEPEEDEDEEDEDDEPEEDEDEEDEDGEDEEGEDEEGEDEDEEDEDEEGGGDDEESIQELERELEELAKKKGKGKKKAPKKRVKKK